MCILIHHPINTQFAAEQLQDFYNKNPDGFGAIVKRGDTVEVIKSVGKIDEIIDLYNSQVSGNEAIIHFRMKTHGEINIANCHPYEVVPGIYMAHNGVLSTGNAADPKMSDTWHYIQDFLKPILEHDPEMLFNAGFQRMIAGHIGSGNKFGFMDQSGRTVIINRTSGVDHSGVWYSNTYAWTPWKFGYGQPPAARPMNTYTGKAASNQYGFWDDRYATSSTWRAWNEMDKQMSAQPKRKTKRVKRERYVDKLKMDTATLKRILRASYNAVNLEGFTSVCNWVEKFPLAASRLIYEIYGNENSKYFNARCISDMVNNNVGEAADLICEIWEEMEEDLCELADIQVKGENHVAPF